MQHTHRMAWVVLGALVAAAPAFADDFAPPPWTRGDPLSTAAEWEFTSPGFGPHAPDGSDVTTVIGDGGGSAGGAPTASIFGSGAGGFPVWGSGDGDGEWTATGTTTSFIDFYIPNWIDTEPLKHIRVQVTYDGATPFIPLILADDPSGPVTVDPPIATPFDSSHVLFDIFLEPNPDYEFIHLELPLGTSVDQVVIDTLSLPEPATAVLLAAGCGLLLIRRRRA